MAAFELGEYWRVTIEDWNEHFAGVIDQGDFFEYEGYYYILADKFDDELLEIENKDLYFSVDWDQYVYFSSSVHFGEYPS